MIQPEPRTLYVFDIDGTLFNSEAYAHLLDHGKFVRKLGHGEYNTYKLKDTESYDFQEFRSGMTFKNTAQPIDQVLNQAKQLVHGQHDTSKTILLTARSKFHDHENFLQTFRNHGFPIDKVEVYLAGNLMGANRKLPTPMAKSMVLKPYVMSKKYDRIYVWDDSKENLEALEKLEKYNKNCTIKGFFVDKMGIVTEYNSPILESYQNIKIPEHSLNIARENMPQVGKHLGHFLTHLKDQGVEHTREMVAPKEMKATQADFSKDIIRSVMKRKPDLQPVLMSHDNYILDGHHRWLAAYNTNKNKPVPVIRIHTGILDLLGKAKQYPHTEYRSLSASETRTKIREVVKESVANAKYK